MEEDGKVIVQGFPKPPTWHSVLGRRCAERTGLTRIGDGKYDFSDSAAALATAQSIIHGSHRTVNYDRPFIAFADVLGVEEGGSLGDEEHASLGQLSTSHAPPPKKDTGAEKNQETFLKTLDESFFRAIGCNPPTLPSTSFSSFGVPVQLDLIKQCKSADAILDSDIKAFADAAVFRAGTLGKILSQFEDLLISADVAESSDVRNMLGPAFATISPFLHAAGAKRVDIKSIANVDDLPDLRDEMARLFELFTVCASKLFTDCSLIGSRNLSINSSSRNLIRLYRNLQFILQKLREYQLYQLLIQRLEMQARQRRRIINDIRMIAFQLPPLPEAGKKPPD